MDRTDHQLAEAFRHAMQLRTEMREQGASERECSLAIEKILRANWPTPPESEWPYWARVPRCMHCNGYGLIIRSVVNRLKCTVDEGTPCTCHLGDRYREKPKAEQDFTAAGKTTPVKKGFTRWNG
jgi:hypothetical protein